MPTSFHARIVVAIVVTCTMSAAIAADVRVLAAASLKEALDDQAKVFEGAGRDHVVVSYAASNALARQIEAGAPADLFISADVDWMDYVEQRRLLKAGTRTNLLRNALVLIAPASSANTLKIAPDFPLAAALGSQKLAMANPDSVPAGKYGKRALEELGVWKRVERNVARADNVKAALVLVSRGEAPFGIVYTTDAIADRSVRVVDTFPESTHPPIVYPAAVIATSRSTAAQALLDYLKSPAALTVWEKHGFTTVR
ncbi:MAG TPA: molybdate ABC transporter substrate-binding protein [Casimicrobiaceae bacterium]|nr:molybdate ABC transporter substrate-binding protein [Casimicrobiaceae bacterium]